MNGNSNSSRAATLLFNSPYSLLIFLVIPAYTIIGLRLGMSVSGDLLLVNNGCMMACVALRAFRYVTKLRRGIRYGADFRQPESVSTLDRSLAGLKSELDSAGYCFDTDGRYGEKRDIGYVGTTLLYCGLLILLLFGSYDYMREYSVMARLGVGEPISLDKSGLLGAIEAGNLASLDKLPQLQVRKQTLPNEQWPQGATEIALLTKDRKELATATIAPGKPFRYGGLDYHMTRFLFDSLIVIREGNLIVYDSFIKFLPLQQKKDVYSYVTSLRNPQFPDISGTAWLNPEKKAVRIEMKRADKNIIDIEVELWGKNKKEQGPYIASIEGLAHWSEIRVARGRHRVMLMIGAVLFLCGGITRLMFRSQRVWLEEAAEGCRVRVVGGETKKLVGQK